MSLPLRTRTVYRTVALIWCKDAGWVRGLISRKGAGMIALHGHAPVAQLDRALVSGTKGRRFESSQARHKSQHHLSLAINESSGCCSQF